MVVEAVVCHWELLVERETWEDRSDDREAGQTTTGRTIRGSDDRIRQAEEGNARFKVQAAFFYADGGMVASTDPV